MISLLEKVRQKFKHRVVLLFLSDRLAAIGLKISPYYLVQECLFDDIDTNLNPKLDAYEVGLLEPSEIRTILAHPENIAVGDEQVKRWLADDCRCFGIKDNGDIVAYMWYNLRRCHSKFSPFLLKKDEAYLFGAKTFKAYRGKNLATYLRYQLYRHLNKIGRTRFFSITELFNTPAVRFKEKLKARTLRVGLYVELFDKLHWNIFLKKY